MRKRNIHYSIGFLAGMFLLIATTQGCIKRKKQLTQAQKETIKEYILDELPSDVSNKVDVNFDDKIHLLGWRAEPAIAAPGTTVHLTLYWKKTGDLDDGWKLFTHVTDDALQSKTNMDCQGGIRTSTKGDCEAQLYSPSDWEKGKFIKDSFEYTVPNDVTWTAHRFLVGVWKGDARLHIKNADASDGQNRANVIVVPTGVKPAEQTPPKTEIPQLKATKFGRNEIKIDGKIDESSWQKAGFTGPFLSPSDGKSVTDYPIQASAKLGWDETHLYAAFVVQDKDPAAPFKSTDVDPHLWEKSSGIELMIQPGDMGDNKDYYEIQVDTAGAIFDTHWDDYNQPTTQKDGNTVFGHMDWTSNAKRAAMVDKPSGTYTIEVALPWASLTKARDGISIPPSVGSKWRVNLYAFRDGQKYALAWSPILGQGNFHKSSRFGIVQFEELVKSPISANSPNVVHNLGHK